MASCIIRLRDTKKRAKIELFVFRLKKSKTKKRNFFKPEKTLAYLPSSAKKRPLALCIVCLRGVFAECSPMMLLLLVNVLTLTSSLDSLRRLWSIFFLRHSTSSVMRLSMSSLFGLEIRFLKIWGKKITPFLSRISRFRTHFERYLTRKDTKSILIHMLVIVEHKCNTYELVLAKCVYCSCKYKRKEFLG